MMVRGETSCEQAKGREHGEKGKKEGGWRRRKLTSRRNDQTATLARTAVHRLDNVDQLWVSKDVNQGLCREKTTSRNAKKTKTHLLLVVDGPVDLVVVTCGSEKRQ